jgi:ABC-type glycerol-3-phosphate transport system permease component
MSQAVSVAGRATARGRTRGRGPRAGTIARITGLLFFSVIFITPLFWLVSTAFKSEAELGASPIHWLPLQPRVANFGDAWTLIDYWKFTWHSLFLAGMNAVLVTTTSALVGFGFGRLKGKGKNALFILMLSTIMLPPVVTIIPTYVMFARLGLIDTYWPWAIWGLTASPFFAFLFRQFFASIPLEMEDAAIIDGCGYGRIFLQLFLPLSKPVIATVIIFAFQGVWGDWLAPNIFLSSDNTTLAVAMTAGYTDPHGNVLTTVLSAGVIFYILPVLVLFFFAQRYFVQGIVTTGLKG